MKKQLLAIILFFALGISILSVCSRGKQITVKDSSESESNLQPVKQEPVILTGWLDSGSLLEKVPGYRQDYDEYIPNAIAVSELREFKEEINITVVLGTWCPDTARELPRFLRSLTAANNPALKVKYFGVNRGFREKDDMARQLQVVAVPTFILTHADKEIGRIIETPELSIEEDIAMVIASLKHETSK